MTSLAGLIIYHKLVKPPGATLAGIRDAFVNRRPELDPPFVIESWTAGSSFCCRILGAGVACPGSA